ncbi:MAG: hypothetical protein IJX53_06240 [Clostridia bacterium]|nr:hypothetical protein [Clostridia bacterium]
MNTFETANALTEIAQVRVDEFDAQIAALDPTAKTERKALTIARQMASHAAAFAQMPARGGTAFVGGGGSVAMYERRIFREFPWFRGCEAAYRALDEDGQGSFRTYAFAFGFIKETFYDKRKAVLDAPDGASANARFEAQVICGVLGDILTAWQAWWRENGCVACEVAV